MNFRDSIDLTREEGNCWAKRSGRCTAMSFPSIACVTYACPFSKPEECKDWIRIEQNGKFMLVPPEEYAERRRRIPQDPKPEVWKLMRVRP